MLIPERVPARIPESGVELLLFFWIHIVIGSFDRARLLSIWIQIVEQGFGLAELIFWISRIKSDILINSVTSIVHVVGVLELLLSMSSLNFIKLLDDVSIVASSNCRQVQP